MNTHLADRIYRIMTLLRLSHRSPQAASAPLPDALLEQLLLELAACDDLGASLPGLLAPLQRRFDIEPSGCALYLALQIADNLQLYHAPHLCPPAGLAGAITYQLGSAGGDAGVQRLRRPGGGPALQGLRLFTAPDCHAWLLLDFSGPQPDDRELARHLLPLRRALGCGLTIWHRQQQRHRQAVSCERHAFAAELHDSVAQILGYINLKISKLQNLADTQNNVVLQGLADDLAQHTRLASRHTRELIASARLSLDGAPLHGALEKTIREFEQRSSLVFELDDRSQPLDLPEAIAVQLVFIVREALCNAVRHAHARQVRVQLLRPDDETLQLRVEDDGRGLGAVPPRPDSFGLGIMRERAQRIGGRYHIGDRPGGGTRLDITLALNKESL